MPRAGGGGPGLWDELASGVVDMITSDHLPGDISRPDDIAVCLAALTAAVIRLDEELAP